MRQDTLPGLERPDASSPLIGVKPTNEAEAAIIAYMWEKEQEIARLKREVFELRAISDNQKKRISELNALHEFDSTTRGLVIDLIQYCLDKDADAFSSHPVSGYRYAAPFESRYPAVREFLTSSIIIKDECENGRVFNDPAKNVTK